VITLSREDINQEEFELEMIDAGIENIEIEDDHYILTAALEDFGNVRKKLEEMGLEPENAGLQRIPTETKKLTREEAIRVLRLIEEFEDDDDVQYVFHNLEVTEEILESLDV
jgi:transcriptional/translational regulatory protein YebC/TACO1